MSIKLHKAGYEHALKLIANGLEVEPDQGNWDEVQPTQDEIIRFLDTHSLNEYGLWFLGVDTSRAEKDPTRFVYPYGDLKVIHESALIEAEQDAMDKDFTEIEEAAGTLLDMVQDEQD